MSTDMTMKKQPLLTLDRDRRANFILFIICILLSFGWDANGGLFHQGEMASLVIYSAILISSSISSSIILMKDKDRFWRIFSFFSLLCYLLMLSTFMNELVMRFG